MDIRDIYALVYEAVDEASKPELKELVAGMKTSGADGDQSVDAHYFREFVDVAGSRNVKSQDFGFGLAQKYLDKLIAENGNLGGLLKDVKDSLREDQWVEKAQIRLAQGYYALLYWFFEQYEKLYRPCHQLTLLVQKFAPMLKDEKGQVNVNPYLLAFTSDYIKKPDIAFDGYVNATTFLLDTSDNTAQTILTRMGRTLWNSVYSLFSLYNPHDSVGATGEIEFDKESEDFKGDEIVGLAPLFVFLGYRLEAEYGGHVYGVRFPFDPVDPMDVEVYKDGKKVKSLSYLDDLAMEKLADGKSFYDIVRACPKVTITKPLDLD